MITEALRTGTFDPSSLKPDDEVGITWRSLSGQAEFPERDLIDVPSVEDTGRILKFVRGG